MKTKQKEQKLKDLQSMMQCDICCLCVVQCAMCDVYWVTVVFPFYKEMKLKEKGCLRHVLAIGNGNFLRHEFC